MLGLYGGEDLDVIFNIHFVIIFISMWEIWKIRNKEKYYQSRIGDQTIFNTWKNNKKIIIYNAYYKLPILMKLIKTNWSLFGITYNYILFINIKLMHDNNCIF